MRHTITKFLTHQRQQQPLAAADTSEIHRLWLSWLSRIAAATRVCFFIDHHSHLGIIRAIELTGATMLRPSKILFTCERVTHNLSANRWRPVPVLVNTHLTCSVGHLHVQFPQTSRVVLVVLPVQVLLSVCRILTGYHVLPIRTLISHGCCLPSYAMTTVLEVLYIAAIFPCIPGAVDEPGDG
jgi:hypothetical protein